MPTASRAGSGEDSSVLRLGFAGTPEFAVAALDALAALHRVCAVFTQPDRGAGRGRRLHESPVKARAAALGIPVHQPARFDADAQRSLRTAGVDALVVVAYGLLLPAAALSIPRLGCINIHASLLPRWRGAAPIQRAILEGDSRTGITIMRMDEGLDTGPMLASRAIDIGAGDTSQSLHDRLARLGAELIVETLDAVASARIVEAAQPRDGVTYAAKIDKAEALIDWSEDAAVIDRRVRAFLPWPIAETRLEGTQLRILEARALEAGEAALVRANTVLEPAGSPAREDRAGAILSVSAPAGGIDVLCGRGVLRIRKLQLAGRRALTAEEFLRGRKLPARLGDPVASAAR
ncbi:MAG TPA: methionyl-tRNA formyltransferase [Steroidobacteraceae bacterium]|jgi:methionyl-tRNA formyltransferase|nr:methionyl-tRNA formyltransferase [Steroidobacteraceae bacterium]